MKRICLLTRDGITAAYFKALLYGKASLAVQDHARKLPEADLLVVDLDSMDEDVGASYPMPRLTVGREGRADLKRPFTDRMLLTRLLSEKESTVEPHLLPDQQTLLTGSGEYRLSDTEYRLLSELFRAEGAEIDCQSLFGRVWEGREMNLNLLRVTVSHLRRHLKNAELSILSTRGGYRLEL